jgi:hypothetical protein
MTLVSAVVRSSRCKFIHSAEAHLICGSLTSGAHVIIVRCVGQHAVKRHVQVGVAIVRCERDLQ